MTAVSSVSNLEAFSCYPSHSRLSTVISQSI